MCVCVYPRVYLPHMWRRNTSAMNTRLRTKTGTGPLIQYKDAGKRKRRSEEVRRILRQKGASIIKKECRVDVSGWVW